MKTTLTSLTLFAAAFSTVNAQVLEYGFEENQQLPGTVETVNFYQEWTDGGGTFSFQGTPARSGAYAFSVHNPEAVGEANRWERVLKINGLQIKENTCYRVSFWAQAPETANVDVALMCGDIDCDMPFVAPGTEEGSYESFYYGLKGFNEGAYTRQSAVFYYGSDAFQQSIFPSIKADAEALGANRFLRLSFTSVGDYLVDDILVEEANIAGVTFNGDVIKVDFGFQTNAKAIAKATPEGTLVLDASTVKVMLDGAEVTPDAVELKSDGYLYIFLGEEYYLEGEEQNVEVSFTNTMDDFVYDANLTPGNGSKVLDFKAEKGFFDESLIATSLAYEEAQFVSSNPADGSFELPLNINEFTFTYNKPVYTSGEYAPKAILTGGLGLSEELTPKAGQSEVSTSVTFVRTGSEPLTKGTYSVEVSDVTNEKYVPKGTSDAITFEVGGVSVATTIVTLLNTNLITGEVGGIPEGWTCYFNGAVWAGGSGCRIVGNAAGSFTDKAMYLSVRDCGNVDGTYMKYGDQEGYNMHLPKGNVEFSVLAAGWDAVGSGVKFAIEDLAGNVVASGEGTTEVKGNGGEIVTTPSKITVRFNNAAEGDYILKVWTTVESWGGIALFGYSVSTYEVSEGETADSEVLIDEKFSSVSDGSVPAAGTGWNVYDKNVLGAKGQSQSGRNRMMQLTGATPLTGVFYNRCLEGDPATYYMTYGEDDADPEDGIDEPQLNLSASKYNFSYYGTCWKNPVQTAYFQIIDAETQEVVYNREDELTANVNGDRAAVITPNKIEFSYTPAKAGRYILKWYMTGESMIGCIKVEKMGSLAVYYKNLLNDALDLAKAELVNAADEMYAGTTRTALANAIETFTNPDFHTGKEYTDAIAQLNSLVEAMVTRRKAIVSYTAELGHIEELIGLLADTKYTAMDSYVAMVAAYEAQKEVPPSTLEDADLAAAEARLVSSYTLCNNMYTTCVNLLTKQIVDAAAQIVALDDTQAENETVIAAGNALSDDQTLANMLQLQLTSVIYGKCATEDPFSIWNDEYQQSTPDSIALTSYIQNPNVYTTAAKKELKAEEAAVAFPGWNVDAPNGLAADWGWGSWKPASETMPVVDAQFGTSWGTDFKVSQNLKNLPVGVYAIMIGTCDRSHVDWTDGANVMQEGYETASKVFYTIGEQTDSVTFNISNMGQYYGLTNCYIPGIKAVANENSTCNMVYGANLDVESSFGAVDNAQLFMTGKLAGFDYAAAKVAVDQQISTGIESVTATDATLTSVKYYDLSGRQVSQPAGVCVKIATYADGFMKVSKVVVK